MRRWLQQRFGEESAEGTTNDAASRSPLQGQHQTTTHLCDAEAASDGDRTDYLRTQLQNITQMSGVEFEHYMAGVFEVLGYGVTMLGGAGDQGVDLVLHKDRERIAVQCKNYRQPVGNKPVQEVFAGAKHHGIPQAWVVAPAGFTRGALDLAQSTQVTLFDDRDVESWLQQAADHQRVNSLQRVIDFEDYQTLLGLYAHTLETLERGCGKVRQFLSQGAYGAEGKEWCKQMYRTPLHRYVGDFLRDLNTLEARHPRFTTGELAVSRAALEERQRKVQQQFEELGISVEFTVSESGGPEASTVPERALVESTNLDALVVGDTANIADGGWLIVRSYESPLPAPFYKKPEPDHEFSAIEVEGYAGQNPADYLDHLQQSDF
jgi:hypothetical protein